MHKFYRIMKKIQSFAANFLSYIPTKYYTNWSTSDLVIVKTKRVNFFWKHSVYDDSVGLRVNYCRRTYCVRNEIRRTPARSGTRNGPCLGDIDHHEGRQVAGLSTGEHSC